MLELSRLWLAASNFQLSWDTACKIPCKRNLFQEIFRDQLNQLDLVNNSADLDAFLSPEDKSLSPLIMANLVTSLRGPRLT